MIITIDEIKLYLRLDYDDEDNFLNLCIENAEEYLRNSVTDFDTKIKSEKFKTKAKMLMYLIVQSMFDNRSFSTKDNEKIRFITQSMLMQMENCSYEVT